MALDGNHPIGEPGHNTDHELIDTALSGLAADVAAVEAGARTQDVVVSFPGTIAVGDSMPLYLTRPVALKTIRLTARVGSSSGDVVVDIDRLGTVTEASIFTDTNARPTLTAGRTFEATHGRGYEFNAGDLIHVQVISKGTGVSDLAAVLTFEDVAGAPYLDVMSNTGQGSAAGAVTTANSFAGDNQWTSLNDPTNGTLDWDATYALTGHARSMKVVAPASTDIQAVWDFPAVTNEIYGRVFYRKPAIETTGETRFIRFKQGGANKGSIRLTATNGYLSLLNATSVEYGVGSVAVSTTGWNRIEFRLVQGAGGFGQAWLFKTNPETGYVPDSYVYGANAGISTTGWDQIQFGRVASLGGPYTFWLAGMAVGTRGKFGVL